MVRISSTGDILPDDNKAGSNSNNSGANSNNSGGAQRRQGSVQHENYNQQEQAAMQGEGGGVVSVFGALNDRLLALGIPRWNAGSYVIEPIVSVAFLLAGLFLGFPGIIMGLVLFAVVKLSQSGGIPGMDYLFGLNQNTNNRPKRGNNDRRPRGGGRGGHRLGNS